MVANFDPWIIPPKVPELGDEEVHVWQVCVNDVYSEDLMDILSDDDRHRAGRFRFDRDRQTFVASHAALRSLLAYYLKVGARDVYFILGTHGKPALTSPLGASGIQFNLSHSQHRALIAIARHKAVGIDIEFVKMNFDFDEVAERFFTRREMASLGGLPPLVQRETFFKCWTSKEAFLKAKGSGLAGPLDEVEILTVEGEVKIQADVPYWSLIELAAIPGYQGALVTSGANPAVRYFLWQPASRK